jgi:hypothetical protein
MGEVAGRAAKLVVREGVLPTKVNVKKPRKELVVRGAYLRS